MNLVIKIDKARFKDIQRIASVQFKSNYFQTAEQIIASGSDVLGKIKAEVEKIETYDGLYVDRTYVLQIIDKYRK